MADKKYLLKNEINVVVQINGKKRGLINMDNELEEKEILNQIKNDENINKYLINKNIKRTIYVKNKIFNIIL